ncbi:BON domain-containing protein [Paraburkholderia tropica]
MRRVTTRNGNITHSGVVVRAARTEKAGRIVAGIDGVANVRNGLSTD